MIEIQIAGSMTDVTEFNQFLDDDDFSNADRSFEIKILIIDNNNNKLEYICPGVLSMYISLWEGLKDYALNKKFSIRYDDQSYFNYDAKKSDYVYATGFNSFSPIKLISTSDTEGGRYFLNEMLSTMTKMLKDFPSIRSYAYRHPSSLLFYLVTENPLSCDE